MKNLLALLLILVGAAALGYYFLVFSKASTGTQVAFTWPYSQQNLVYYLDTAKFNYKLGTDALTISDANSKSISIKLRNAAGNEPQAISFFMTWPRDVATGDTNIVPPTGCNYIVVNVHYPFTGNLEDQIDQISCKSELLNLDKLDSFATLN